MSYTAQSMMNEAEKHYREAVRLTDPNPHHAIACALQGLLACELSKYADDPNRGVSDL